MGAHNIFKSYAMKKRTVSNGMTSKTNSGNKEFVFGENDSELRIITTRNKILVKNQVERALDKHQTEQSNSIKNRKRRRQMQLHSKKFIAAFYCDICQ